MARFSCPGLVAGLCVLTLPLPVANAAILTHNGLSSSTPAGTNDVDVALTNHNHLVFPADFLELNIDKEFFEIATHQAAVSFFALEIPVFEAVVNGSNEPWGEFRIELESAMPIRFLGAEVDPSSPAPLMDPVGLSGAVEFAVLGLSEVTVASSAIEQTSENLASLVIHFGDAVDPGDAFTLRFGVQHDTVPEVPQFVMRESPVYGESSGVGDGGAGQSSPQVVPEPSTFVTFGGLALCAALRVNRRRRKDSV